MTDSPLRLRAVDSEDLQIVAAILQDAIIPVCDIGFDSEAKRFLMVVNRFRWERLTEETLEGEPVFERINCVLTIEGVTDVKTQRLDLTERGRMLDLLTIMQSEKALLLVFAGGMRIRLDLADWSLKLEDVGEPWPTPKCPHHQDFEPAS